MIRRIALSAVIGLPLFLQAQAIARLNVQRGQQNKDYRSRDKDEVKHHRFPSLALPQNATSLIAAWEGT
jgi:hypothetical protein